MWSIYCSPSTKGHIILPAVTHHPDKDTSFFQQLLAVQTRTSFSQQLLAVQTRTSFSQQLLAIQTGIQLCPWRVGYLLLTVQTRTPFSPRALEQSLTCFRFQRSDPGGGGVQLGVKGGHPLGQVFHHSLQRSCVIRPPLSAHPPWRRRHCHSPQDQQLDRDGHHQEHVEGHSLLARCVFFDADRTGHWTGQTRLDKHWGLTDTLFLAAVTPSTLN